MDDPVVCARVRTCDERGQRLTVKVAKVRKNGDPLGRRRG